MADEQFSVEDQTKSSEGGCTTAIIGCLVVLLILAALACGVGYYVYLNIGNWISGQVESTLGEVIDNFDIPEAQKAGMKEQIGRVAESYREGEIGVEQVGQIVEKIADSPAFSVIPIEMARAQYIAPSGLSDEEKADATRQLQRVAHGRFELLISDEEINTLVEEHIADRQPDGNLQFRESLTDEELREFIAASKALADSHDVPDENFEIDLAAELKKAVDEVLLGVSADEPQMEVEAPEAVGPPPPQEAPPIDEAQPVEQGT